MNYYQTVFSDIHLYRIYYCRQYIDFSHSEVQIPFDNQIYYVFLFRFHKIVSDPLPIVNFDLFLVHAENQYNKKLKSQRVLSK